MENGWHGVTEAKENSQAIALGHMGMVDQTRMGILAMDGSRQNQDTFLEVE